MARAAASSRRRQNDRVITVDFTGVDREGGGGFKIPEGDYLMAVDSVEHKESKSSGDPMFEWVFKGKEGKAKGKTFYYYTPLGAESLWKLAATLEHLGVDVPDEALDIDLDELVELELVGTVEDDTYQGKTRSKLVNTLPLDEDGGEKDDPPPRRTGKTKPGSRKPSRVTKVAADEVKEMDEDELQTLIEKHDLDVDLSDHKTLTKKRGAVVAGLEEKELLEE